MGLDLATLALAVLPVLVLGGLFLLADRARPEPSHTVGITMALGIASCVPVALAELSLRAALGPRVHLAGRFLDAFLVAAFIEEVAKLGVVLAYPWRKPAFDEVMDGVLYTAAAGLGFGLLENLLYLNYTVARAFSVIPGMPEATPLPDGRTAIVLALVRAFSAVPMHALASGLMGYCIGRARFADVLHTSEAFRDALDRLPAWLPRSVAWCALGLFFAVAVHGSYDWVLFALGADREVLLAAPGILLLAAVALHRSMRRALELDEALRGARRSSVLILQRPPEVS
ncbi:MAG: PrsW family intramembrane metalloprotease [Deltaproteobacteria bacterium]|nr:PrsW family intramembrane metalloprotease [Deltaproteobacteria bacterium]